MMKGDTRAAYENTFYFIAANDHIVPIPAMRNDVEDRDTKGRDYGTIWKREDLEREK